ncbi:MAG: transglutaminaseTgpA domain-containing protein, partial [Chloroflexota bacterium]|nr:transglutaminaseTgpA domain-containing protein [Chloroflexota bacterium]
MDVVTHHPRPGEPAPGYPSRSGRLLGPTEGWDVLALHLVLVVCAAIAVQTAGWSGLRISLPMLAIGAALLGVGLAKSWLPDGMAHLVAVMTAAGASLLVVAMTARELEGTLLARMQIIGRRSVDWYLGRGIERDDALLLSLLMGALMWLLAYLAAWTLFRRSWLFASLLLPGFLILVNLGYAPVPVKAPLIVYLLVSGILTARYHLYRRQRQWARWGIPFPTAMGTRFFLTGASVAMLAVVVGWLAPRSLAHAPLEPLLDRVEQPLLTAQERLTGWLDDSASGSEGGPTAESGRFTNFDDSFAIGGPLQLTDTPAVLLQADQAAYLAAHRYDTYSGRGWSSSVEATFDGRAADGQNYSPEMTFQAGQDVPLSDGVRGARSPVSGAVTVLSRPGNVLLTSDTFVTADMPTSVRLSWRRVDGERFAIDGQSIGDLPPDLQRMAVLLARAQYSPGAADSSLPDHEPDLAGQIQREQLELSRRFLTVGWDVDDQGQVVALIVSGQLPVYDDVEAVF